MIKFAEFCAGIGGFRLGLENLGWQCVYSCEIDEKCEKTYQANFGKNFDSYNIFDIEPGKLPYFDVLCSGFPCQPFSVAGKQLGLEDPRGNILFGLLKIISQVKPPILLLENVQNFISHASGKTFQLLLSELHQLDYCVYYDVLDSAFFGIPQQRKRVYIVAIKNEYGNPFFSITKKKMSPVPFRDFLASGDFSIPITQKWEQYIDLYTGKIPLSEMKFEVPKTRVSLERVNKGVKLEDCILQMRSSGIRACSIDAPLPTFAVSHSGGGAMIPVYTRERRHLNLIEMKRLMGFPDEFRFNVSRTHAIKQLSNAVCPPVITSLGNDIQTFLLSNHANNRWFGSEIITTIQKELFTYK